MLEDVLTFIGGLVVLVTGAEALVRGAAKLALALGMSTMIVGLTVVAFGTSAPEAAISISAVFEGSQIAFGNVVGSNIFNILFVLGLGGVLATLPVSRDLLGLDLVTMLVATVVVTLFGLDGAIDRIEGLVLFAGICGYIWWMVRRGRREAAQKSEELDLDDEPGGEGSSLLHLGLLVAGLVMLTVGSQWLVDGAVGIARAMNVSELVIGLTIVAIGTSAPEVATTIVAITRGERDLAVGNAVGSCIFNLLFVLGIAGSLGPEGVEVPAQAIALDVPVMLAASFVCVPIFLTDWRISRPEGLMLLCYWAGYTTFLVLGALGHATQSAVGGALLYAAIPASVLGLSVKVVMQLRSAILARRRAAEERESTPGG